MNASGNPDGWAVFVGLGGDTTVADILATFDAIFAGTEPDKVADIRVVGGLMGHDLAGSFYTTVDFASGNYAVITSIGADRFPYSGRAAMFTVR